METTWKAGLEDVIAARSAITAIDGAEGRLYHRGYEIGELAAHASFEETTHLLWFGELPSPTEGEAFAARLRAARALPPPVLALLRTLPADAHPLDVLRTAVSLAATVDPDGRAGDAEANLRKAFRLTALVPGGGRGLAAAAHGAGAGARRRRRARTPPTSSVSSTAARPRPTSPGSSTRSSRSTRTTSSTPRRSRCGSPWPRWRISTRPLTAAIATLKGPRHGGANEDVLAMLLEIGDPGRAEAYVAARLDAHARGTRAERADPRARIPGFGHRVYRVDDARARVLRQMAKTMAEATGHARLFEVAERVYAAMTARTGLPVNVDFFSAVVYHALGIPGDLCTSIFAVGRVAGWCAHALEQYADNRLIRPRADYVGVPPREVAAPAR